MARTNTSISTIGDGDGDGNGNGDGSGKGFGSASASASASVSTPIRAVTVRETTYTRDLDVRITSERSGRRSYYVTLRNLTPSTWRSISQGDPLSIALGWENGPVRELLRGPILTKRVRAGSSLIAGSGSGGSGSGSGSREYVLRGEGYATARTRLRKANAWRDATVRRIGTDLARIMDLGAGAIGVGIPVGSSRFNRNTDTDVGTGSDAHIAPVTIEGYWSITSDRPIRHWLDTLCNEAAARSDSPWGWFVETGQLFVLPVGSAGSVVGSSMTGRVDANSNGLRDIRTRPVASALALSLTTDVQASLRSGGERPNYPAPVTAPDPDPNTDPDTDPSVSVSNDSASDGGAGGDTDRNRNRNRNPGRNRNTNAWTLPTAAPGSVTQLTPTDTGDAVSIGAGDDERNETVSIRAYLEPTFSRTRPVTLIGSDGGVIVPPSQRLNDTSSRESITGSDTDISIDTDTDTDTDTDARGLYTVLSYEFVSGVSSGKHHVEGTLVPLVPRTTGAAVTTGFSSLATSSAVGDPTGPTPKPTTGAGVEGGTEPTPIAVPDGPIRDETAYGATRLGHTRLGGR